MLLKSTYEIVWPDGLREEFVGRETLMEMINDERKLQRITAKSTEPIRQVMREVKSALIAKPSCYIRSSRGCCSPRRAATRGADRRRSQ